MTSHSSNQLVIAPKHFNPTPKHQAQDIQTLKAHFKNDLNYLQHEITAQMTAKLTNNRQQVLFAFNDFYSSLMKRLGELLFSTFSSFTENIHNSDLESLDISNWINSSLSLFETQLGTLPINQDKVLEIVNGFTHIWASKLANVSKLSNIQEHSLSGQFQIPDNSMQSQEQISQNSRRISDIASSPAKTDRANEKVGASPSASEKKGSLFGKVRSLFKQEKSQAGSEGPTKMNLGNEKNFRWDPVKKRYIFEDDEGEEEEKDEGPPPSMGSQQKVEKQGEKESITFKRSLYVMKNR